MSDPFALDARARTRRRLLLAGLFGLLALWLVLHYLHTVEEQERYERKMLTAERVTVRAIPPSEASVDAVAEDAFRAALGGKMRAISSCLATEEASRAPVTLRVEVAEARLQSASWALDEGPLREVERACLEGALEGAEWPRATGPLEATLELRPIR